MSSIALPTTSHIPNVYAPLPQDQVVASYGNGTTKMVIPKSSFGYHAVVISQESSADQTIEGFIQGAGEIHKATRELLSVLQKKME